MIDVLVTFFFKESRIVGVVCYEQDHIPGMRNDKSLFKRATEQATIILFFTFSPWTK